MPDRGPGEPGRAGVEPRGGTAVRARLRGRALRAARRGARAGEGRVRGGAAGHRREPHGARRPGAGVGHPDEAAGRRGQRAVLRPVGLPHRRAHLHRPDRHSRRGRRLRSHCSWTGAPRRRARSTSPPAPTPRTCAGVASSTRAGAASSISPTSCSGRPDAEAQGDAALLAAVNAPRGEGMRDIVATIQAEQDEIIRLDHPGVTVIEGGPGTGKTVVALHRVAYLLYTQRERIERHGVLVVGPNPAFLDHIGRVLPSLGESDVVFMTPGDLVPGLHVTAEDTARRRARSRAPGRCSTSSPRPSPTTSGCPRIRCRSPSAASGCRSTPRPRRGRGTRHARAGGRTTRPARCSPRSSRTCSPSARWAGSAGAGCHARTARRGNRCARSCSVSWQRTRRSPPCSTRSGPSSSRRRCSPRCTPPARACGRPAGTRGCSGWSAGRGRCSTCRCSTSSSTSWVTTPRLRSTGPPSRTAGPRPSTPTR